MTQELGGKSPNIVLDDDAFARSVVSGVTVMMLNTGQSCNAPSRMLVPRKLVAEVEAIAADWLKAVRQMPGGAAVKMRVFFPTVASGAGNVDFYFVLNAPSFTDWGKIWDAYQDDSAAAKSDDLNRGKVTCADSQLWEAHAIEAK